MTDFSTIAITATGSTTPRTMPDRLTDITDVKNWGAKGDGVADDWAAIMLAYNHGQISLVTTASNQTASFNGLIAHATFNGTCASNTLTINSGLSGVVVVGQTLVTSLGNRVITSGSGSSWTYGGAVLNVGPEAMSTNTVLVASGVVGAIAVGNPVLGAGVSSGQNVLAQQTGSAGSDGVYVMPVVQNVGASLYDGLVATRGSAPSGIRAETQAMGRLASFTRSAVTKLKIITPNWYNGEIAPGSTATVKASIEYPAGTFTQITWSSTTSATVPNGGQVTSDYVNVNIPANTQFWIRIYFTCASGVVFCAFQGQNLSLGDALAVGNSGVADLTMSGTVTDGGIGASIAPLAIIAPITAPSVCIIGDSISLGVDNDHTPNAVGDNGAIAPLIGPSFGYSLLAVNGESASDFVSTHTNRLAAMAYCSHLYCGYGTNGLELLGHSVAQEQADLTTIYALAPAGTVTFQNTLVPRTNSTDLFATTVNQTPVASESKRVAFNAALRAGTFGPNGGYFDPEPVVGTGTNNSLWKVVAGQQYTTDGVHPNTFAYYTALQNSGYIDLSRIHRLVTMTTVGGLLTFASVPNFASINGRYLKDPTTPSAFDPVFVPNVFSATATTITCGPVIGLVNAGDTITVNLPAKGIIDFPLGTYNVSQPIDFGDPNVQNVMFRGAPGTTIVGNFADYVFRRKVPDTSGKSGGISVEGFTVINNHPNGGGIRIGYTVGGAVRDCVVTANHGINTASDDTIAGVTSQEMAIVNCYLSPGANPTGSIGIMSVSDGPIRNCHVVGFDKGIITWGQQGGMTLLGCTIELCGFGLQPGFRPDGGGDIGSGMYLAGMLFKNCGTAIAAVGGSTGGAHIEGVVIEATEGTIAGNPQYGMRLDGFGSNFISGVRVTGQYAQYAIEILGGEITNPADNWMIGVQAFNTSSLVRPAWKLPPTAGTVHFVNCNVAPVFTMANLPAYPYGITSINWSAGTTTVVVAGNVGPLMGTPFTVTISGIAPSGFNGKFNATAITTNTLTYAQSNPGAGSGTGSGTATINLTPVASAPAANEGDCYNVNDSDTAAQSANPSVTPGSNHVKVRWSGSNWAVAGK